MSLLDLLITLGFGSIALALMIYSVGRREKHDRAVLDRVKAHPQDVLEIILCDDDPAALVVCFKDGDHVKLRYELGDQAVQKYQELKADLPEASFRLYFGNREVSGRSAAV